MINLDEVKKALIDAILKDGEGKRIRGETYFEATGKRLFEPEPKRFKQFKAKNAPNGVFYMGTTDAQIDAHWLNGKIVIAYTGYERHKVYEQYAALKVKL